MVDFGESDMIKIREKVDKSNIYKGFRNNISFFLQGRTSSDLCKKKKKKKKKTKKF